VRRGEVWWHEPPDEKARPVLVLTRDDVIARALDVVAMPASRTAHTWLTEVEIGPEDGMPTTSFLIAENTLSAEKIYLTECIAELGAAKMDTVCRALATATSCR
jgi:mRNA interferase MazF